MPIAVMSFNLRCAGMQDGPNNWIHRCDAAASLVQQLLPDLMGTQEATKEMLEDMQQRLPDYDFIGVGRGGKLSGESVSIFFRPSKLQVVAADHFWLSHNPQQPGSRLPEVMHQRMCTWVRFRLRETAEEFQVYNTHLDHRQQYAREYGAHIIRQHILLKRSFESLPTLVMGDMNTNPDNEAIRIFLSPVNNTPFLLDTADWLRSRGTEVGGSFHGFKGQPTDLPIDYIFHTPEFETTSFQIYTDQISGRYPSDHFPLVAELVLNE